MRNVMLAVVGLAVFAGLATSAPVPKALKKKPLRATIEPLPGEKVYSISFYDEPLDKVMDQVEQLTGLMFLSKDSPKVNITLKAEGECLTELFEQINEQLGPANWVLLRKAQSFAVIAIDEKLDRLLMNVVTLDELPKHRWEVVQMILPVGKKGYDAAVEARRSIGKNTLEVSTFGTDKVLICGVGKYVQKFIAEMGDHIKK